MGCPGGGPPASRCNCSWGTRAAESAEQALARPRCRAGVLHPGQLRGPPTTLQRTPRPYASGPRCASRGPGERLRPGRGKRVSAGRPRNPASCPLQARRRGRAPGAGRAGAGPLARGGRRRPAGEPRGEPAGARTAQAGEEARAARRPGKGAGRLRTSRGDSHLEPGSQRHGGGGGDGLCSGEGVVITGRCCSPETSGARACAGRRARARGGDGGAGPEPGAAPAGRRGAGAR